ncbi:hypothetical protein [Spirosoma luteum]|uniref:hypothetical protein n=1 Tax=Spirosoma luteum TaxID=431553 RepID=UPI000362C2B5|nr:hypothetical protein [Spirosoma luteum]
MKMNTQSLINLQISLDELVDAFGKLPDNKDNQLHHFSVKFSVIDDFGKDCEQDLLFQWNEANKDWELNTKGHDLLITASSR